MTRSSSPILTLTADELSLGDVVAMADAPGGERTSLFVPTHRSRRIGAQDAVALRTLITGAEAEVVDSGLLVGARALADDRTFWSHPSNGLAVFAEPGRTTAIWLSGPVESCVVVSDRYHLKPLLHQLAHLKAFELLAISRHAARLVRVRGQRVTDVEVPGLPAGLADALRWDDREPHLQSHAGGRVGAGRVTAAFHGQGGAADTHDTDLGRYLRLVDDAIVRTRAAAPTTPLVLAGVDEVVAAYRRATRCVHVADEHVSGNPDGERSATLAARASELVEPVSLHDERRDRDAFAAGGASTVDTVEQAVIAAAAGQVASVFVPVDESCWGRHHPGHSLLDLHEDRRPGDHDLTDVAAVETLRHGGRAHIVPAHEIPGAGPVAATLHY